MLALKILFWAALLLLIVAGAIGLTRAYRKNRSKLLFVLIGIVLIGTVVYLDVRYSLPSYINDFLTIFVALVIVDFWMTVFHPLNKQNAGFYAGYGFGLRGRFMAEDAGLVQQPEINSWNPLEKFAYKHHHLFFAGGVALLVLVGVISYWVYSVKAINILWVIPAWVVAMFFIYYLCKILFIVEGQALPKSTNT